MRLLKQSVKAKIMAVAVLPTVMLVAVCALAVWNIHAMQLASERVAHTYRVIDEASNAYELALIMQTSNRGFALTGDDAHVAAYDEASAKSFIALESLAAMVSDNAAQIERIGTAVSLLKDWQEASPSRAIAARQAVRTDEEAAQFLQFFTSLSGSDLFSGFRDEIQAIITTEDMLLAERSAASASANQLTYISVGSGIALALAVGGVFSWLMGSNVAGPLSNLTRAMGELTAGRLNVEVQHADRTDEVGKIAAALSIFKANAVRMAELAGEEEGRRAANLARQDMMQRFQLAFAEVVEAALDGDLTKRISERYGDDEIDMVVDSFNDMLDTISGAVSEAGDVLSAMAQADLTQRMNADYRGVFNDLKTNVNGMGEQLAGIMSKIRDTSSGLRMATGEILAGANDLSERSTRQAAAIEQTTAALEQVTITVAANAQRADQASQKARAVARVAETGGETITQATLAMESITQSSRKISDIIGLIDDIAFQTNLLALNASVEAARAGEAGKGFAVVAIEVRRLAQSAAHASDEVKVLIQQSANDVANGTRLVAEASSALGTMLSGVRESSSLITQIAGASEEQSQALAEVSTAVRQMDDMTQRNAALVEQTNAAIEQTEQQARTLDETVEIFIVAPRANFEGYSTKESKVKKSFGAKAKAAARNFLSRGNAAIATDWSEF